MPLQKGSSQGVVSNNIKEFHTGKTYAHTKSKFGKARADRQAVAVAMSEAKGRAFGGVAPMMGQAFNSTMPQMPRNGVAGVSAPNPLMGSPNGINAPGAIVGAPGAYSRGGTTHGLTKGAIVSAVPGRTDKHFTHVPSGSFVIPADIVSGHGEGNTIAGIETLNKLFKLGSEKANHVSKLARGGHVGKPVPVKLAGGEIVVPPENVHETMCRVTKKNLSLSQAHAAMDAWVIAQRKKLRKTLASLPGPAKD